MRNKSKILSGFLITLLSLVLCVGCEEKSKETDAPVNSTTVEPAAITPVQTPMEGATEIPTPSASPTITPQGTPALTNTKHYLRTKPGRMEERIGKLPIRTRVTIQETVVTEWNEVWHRVITEVDGVAAEGYVQDAAVEPGLTPIPTRKQTGLTPAPTNGLELTEHHGADRDGDGVYVVVLDPGHGGRDSGAEYYNTEEQEINLKVAQRAKAYLEQNYSNVKVYLTRNGDYRFDEVDAIDDLEYRVQFALDKGADIFVSCHFNAGASRGGTMVLAPLKENVARKTTVLGTYLLKELCALGMRNLSVLNRISINSRYLDGTPMDGYLITRLTAEKGLVGVIIEHCYMNVSGDRQFWDDEEDLTAMGQADAKAIAAYLELTPVTPMRP